jgi:hypothetical protein
VNSLTTYNAGVGPSFFTMGLDRWRVGMLMSINRAQLAENWTIDHP